MFTNLDFLSIGKSWAPINSAFVERQTNYQTGRKLYEGNFIDVFGEVWRKIASRYGSSYEKIEQVMIRINLFRALTETFKILAFQKEPEIWVGDGDDAVRVDEYYPRQKALNMLKKAFISAHAQGESVLKVYTNSEGEPDISVVNPENWIPIYNPDNLDEITAHVVANTYEVDNSTTVLGRMIDNITTYLNVEIHYKGYYIKRLYQLDKQNVIQSLLSEETIQTGFNGFTVFPFNYGTPVWRDYGISAYTDLIDIVDEIVCRISNNSKILDNHADPQMIVPKEMVEYDSNTGEWLYKRHTANFFGKDGEKPEYLTWDGNLESSEKQLDRILDLFYMVSGTNPQLFGKDIAGNLSGEALAKILIVPIAKTKEMILSLEDAFEKAFNCVLELKKINKKVDIEFSIGQFNTSEDITNRVVQEKNAGITSIKRAVELINPRYTEEEVDEEVQLIKADQSNESMTDLEKLYPTDEDEENDKVDEQ